MNTMQNAAVLPGAGLPAHQMPGHWLLARVGKRVLRPGGARLTERMLEALRLSAQDRVVEFAPGLGHTAQRVLDEGPFSYIGVERDDAAITRLQRVLEGTEAALIRGTAEATGLASRCATVVIGEAMLSMQPGPARQRIVAEAARLLQPGGRYAIHELCLFDEDRRDEIQRDLSREVHVGVRLITSGEWHELLASEDLAVTEELHAPMRLLEPSRMLVDEGLPRTLRIACNLLRDSDARERVIGMRRVFRRHRRSIGAVAFVAAKKS